MYRRDFESMGDGSSCSGRHDPKSQYTAAQRKTSELSQGTRHHSQRSLALYKSFRKDMAGAFFDQDIGGATLKRKHADGSRASRTTLQRQEPSAGAAVKHGCLWVFCCPCMAFSSCLETFKSQQEEREKLEALEWIDGVQADLEVIAEEERDAGGLMGSDEVDWITDLLRKVKVLRKRKTSWSTQWYASYRKQVQAEMNKLKARKLRELAAKKSMAKSRRGTGAPGNNRL